MKHSESRHTLYFVGGPARVGKTIVAKRIMRRKHLIAVSTDSIRAAIRNALIGEPHVSVKKINFKGMATFNRPGSLKLHKVSFAKSNQSEDDLAWLGVVGFIDGYDRANKADLLIEGVAVTPEHVHRLKLTNLVVKAAFIGYDSESHAASILAYSKKKEDWVHTWIKEHGGDDSHVREWVRKETAKSATLKKTARKYGYGYFDIARRPFDENISIIADYLLRDRG